MVARSYNLVRSAVAALLVAAAANASVSGSASASHLGLMGGFGHSQLQPGSRVPGLSDHQSGIRGVTGGTHDARNAWFIPYAGGLASDHGWSDCHEADPNGPPLCPHPFGSNHVNEAYSNAESCAGQARSAFFGD